jgi:hypothetical protein
LIDAMRAPWAAEGVDIEAARDAQARVEAQIDGRLMLNCSTVPMTTPGSTGLDPVQCSGVIPDH